MPENPVEDVKAKSKDFIEKAKTGTLDEGTLKWGLSAGAIVAGVSLIFNYWSSTIGPWGASVSGLDLLRFHGGFHASSLETMAIPLAAIYALYLHFGEPSFKLFQMELPGRPKLIYLIGLIVSAVGAVGCMDFIRFGVCLGNLLGLVGLGLLTFVFLKLWQMAPAAPPAQTPPTAPPAPPTPPAQP